ncbi:hypothetical protein [Streptomyces acidiscabies]|uniref:Uncharacterized protein n=1 Tax=Streptomyces acidiscabies TaxID=42234 RepID=A0AAP6BMH6_9ACTN|nr:hypothetical protein [Streptomyces acidiscabies]MBP5938299.1 hypothetical protein [Streptomyces sp. LBUM 1476]MBZ3909325.1 hypothetical protein [Streptomyces acidiscabies]MDX2967426.1 hypothetical protein [Streptomyces acidiscabies]MDX3019982.1 hypothetical protein [Streptomyces acidiscabies]MDX3796709.1 hypothetical protein [Streptomyces acidiscabies]
MDQGLVAMWTAAITGFTSAAGAVLGAGMSGRGNLKVAAHQSAAELEKEGRTELKGRIDKFDVKITALDQAATSLVESLRAGQWTAQVETDYRAAAAMARGAIRAEITPAVADEKLKKAANLVDSEVRALIKAADFVRSNPTYAQDPDSEPSKRWSAACERLELARNLFASAVGDAIGLQN